MSALLTLDWLMSQNLEVCFCWNQDWAWMLTIDLGPQGLLKPAHRWLRYLFLVLDCDKVPVAHSIWANLFLSIYLESVCCSIWQSQRVHVCISGSCWCEHTPNMGPNTWTLLSLPSICKVGQCGSPGIGSDENWKCGIPANIIDCKYYPGSCLVGVW